MKKILVVEDNDAVRENICEILELDGFEVISAINGKKGVILAQECHPDLILCDVMMPELDGFGMLKILMKNELTAGIPFIFLTAKAEKIDYRKGMGLGADDYLTKPFDDTELLDAIEVRLKKSSSQNNTGSGSQLISPEMLNNFLSALSLNRENRLYQKKDKVYTIGGNPYWVFKILSGKVKMAKTNEYGKELIYRILTEGEIFGYESVLCDQTYFHDTVAMEDTKIALIPTKEFLDGILSDAKLTYYFLQKSLQLNISSNERLMEMAYGSVRSKVAKAIIMACVTDDSAHAQVVISREDLASLAGTAKETLIRTLYDFKSEKLIDIEGNSILILDREGLTTLPQ